MVDIVVAGIAIVVGIAWPQAIGVGIGWP